MSLLIIKVQLRELQLWTFVVGGFSLSCFLRKVFKTLLFGFCFFHAVVQAHFFHLLSLSLWPPGSTQVWSYWLEHSLWLYARGLGSLSTAAHALHQQIQGETLRSTLRIYFKDLSELLLSLLLSERTCPTKCWTSLARRSTTVVAWQMTKTNYSSPRDSDAEHVAKCSSDLIRILATFICPEAVNQTDGYKCAKIFTSTSGTGTLTVACTMLPKPRPSRSIF